MMNELIQKEDVTMNKYAWTLKCKVTSRKQGESTPGFISGKLYRVKTKVDDMWEVVSEHGLEWLNEEERKMIFEEDYDHGDNSKY